MSKVPAIVPISDIRDKRSEHDREILRLLVRGEKEVAAGKGHGLEAVLKDADRILAK